MAPNSNRNDMPHGEFMDLRPSTAVYAWKKTLDIIFATLELPASAEVKGKKLAEGLLLLHEGNITLERLWAAWATFVHFSAFIPPRHPWQDAMILCMQHVAEHQHQSVCSARKAPPSVLPDEVANAALNKGKKHHEYDFNSLFIALADEDMFSNIPPFQALVC